MQALQYADVIGVVSAGSAANLTPMSSRASARFYRVTRLVCERQLLRRNPVPARTLPIWIDLVIAAELGNPRAESTEERNDQPV